MRLRAGEASAGGLKDEQELEREKVFLAGITALEHGRVQK